MTEEDGSNSNSIKCVTDESETVDLEERMKKVLFDDDKLEFVNLINTLPCKDDAVELIMHYIFSYDSVKCASAILAGETNGNPQLNFKDYHCSPLHKAANRGSLSLVALFLDHGEDANATTIFGFFKAALPLTVALSSIREAYFDRWWVYRKSLLKIFAIPCFPYVKRQMETVKLLASHTNGLDLEFLKFLKEGKLVELGALLLLGFKPSSACLLQWHKEGPKMEDTMRLLEIFERIGDNLKAYHELRRPISLKQDTIVAEIASIFEDAGVPVTSRDTPVHFNLVRVKGQDIYGRKRPMFLDVVCGLSSRQDIICGSNHMRQGLLAGSRSFCSSSTRKTDKDLAYSAQMRNSAHVVPRLYFWKRYDVFVASLRGLRRL